MFTGIIEELGVVKSLGKAGAISKKIAFGNNSGAIFSGWKTSSMLFQIPHHKLQILAPKVAKGTQPGQSICLNGACLTIVEIEKDLLCFEIMPETLKRTNLGLLQQGDKVNLERALKANGRFDGHIVNGHIDGTGRISRRLKKGGDTVDTVMEIEGPDAILRYIVLKGSVTLDGVSLTISALEKNSFCVNLIPYTLNNTTLGLKKEGNVVNIECDILAKYIDRFLSSHRQLPISNITPSFLKEHGFSS